MEDTVEKQLSFMHKEQSHRTGMETAYDEAAEGLQSVPVLPDGGS